MSASEVLIVEDLDSDYEMMARRFRRLPRAPVLRRTRSVEETSAYLAAAAPLRLPGVIILDLRLIDGQGEELLADLKSRPGTRAIPVVVWSASCDPAVPDRCRRQGADRFVRKTAAGAGAVENIDAIVSYWAGAVAGRP